MSIRITTFMHELEDARSSAPGRTVRAQADAAGIGEAENLRAASLVTGLVPVIGVTAYGDRIVQCDGGRPQDCANRGYRPRSAAGHYRDRGHRVAARERSGGRPGPSGRR